MNLVNQLQASAESDDVLTVLRKAKRLASKLGVDDIDHWLRCEQEGYGDGEQVPEYRLVKGALVFNTNGYIPVGFGMVGDGIMDYPGNILLDVPLAEAMNALVALTDAAQQQQHGLYYPIPESEFTRNCRSRMNRMIASKVSFLLRLNAGHIQAIPEAVKDRILDWACALERRGVLGEGMTFNEQEKQKAHSIIFNLRDCKIEQLNNMGTNLRN